MKSKIKQSWAVRVDPEAMKKLDEIAKEKYRGVSRTQAIGWIIEDEWEKLEKEVEND